jgi:outer membrane protein
MLEVRTKGEADVAQMRATVAADDYEVTRQQQLHSKAILTLKEQMNFPIADSLALCETEDWNAAPVMETAEQIYEQAQTYHPQILQAEQAFQAAKYSFRAAKGAFSPTISLGAGVSTSYYKNLDSPNALTFGEQWKNNAGQYLFATLSIPLFNRLNTLMNVRKQRNNLRRAKESLDYQHTELQRLITEAVFEQQNSWKETEKMQLKMESDSIASLLTIRKWEEGLASPIDVQTATVILLQSRAQLLQCRLTYSYNTHLLNYYKGVPLWTE